jgi:ketosteroid isomerase-like protein
MREQDNLEKVRRAYKAFAEGDIQTLLSLCTDDLEILPAASTKVPWAHPWRGRKEVEQYFKTLAEALDFQEYEFDEFIVSPDSIVVLGHERCLVRTTGRIVEAKWVQILDFRDGLVCRHREYTDTAAWDAGFQSRE